MEENLLRDLFDEKLMDILNALIDNPDKKLSLSQISLKSKINVATAMRILNRLVEQGFVEKAVIGSSKTYQIKRNTKTNVLRKLLNKEKEGISVFVEKATKIKEIEKIILESESNEGAKIILVSKQLANEKIAKIAKQIKTKYNYLIETLTINHEQYESMSKLESYKIADKIIWQKRSS